MSITYFLAPYERQKWLDANNHHGNDSISDLCINSVDYANALSERWPLIKFLHNIEPNAPHFALSWELPENRETFVGLRGNLYQNLQVVSFSRTLKETFVSFVLWHRFLCRRFTHFFCLTPVHLKAWKLPQIQLNILSVHLLDIRIEIFAINAGKHLRTRPMAAL